jgi:hypothetical protein
MTRKEKINRNIGLTFDFLRQVADDPSIINKIPNGSVLEFIEKDFPIKNGTTLNNKYIIKVKSVFEPINKIAEPGVKYEKKYKPLL